jgi:hypothetical protein
MANTITVNTQLDGGRKLLLRIDIAGDGTGEETNTVLVDASALNETFDGLAVTDFRIDEYIANFIGFSATLNWDATANVQALAIPEGDSGFDFMPRNHPIINRAGAGKTGDLLITTVGLGAGDTGTLLLNCSKRVT